MIKKLVTVPSGHARGMNDTGALATIATISAIGGTADILLAFLQHFLLSGTNPLTILKFIASGVFEKAAFSGGNSMALWGLLLHYLVVVTWASFLFFIYPRVPLLQRNRWVSASGIAVFIWVIMNLVILPLSLTPVSKIQFPGALISIGILFLAIGIPFSFLLHRHFRR